MALRHPRHPGQRPGGVQGEDVFTDEGRRAPRRRLPDHGLPPEVAYQLVHDELMLDGNARLNLATFVTSYMDDQAARLMAETVAKNLVDKDEYPQTAALEARCVDMLADLWHAPEPENVVGCSTIGSSEAAMLAGLALKRRWQARRRDAGAPASQPNLVAGINVQVCWEKFANYWDVELRTVPMEGERYHLSPEQAVALCDENTIGVVAIMGSTYDGSYEDVRRLSALLDDLQERTGLDIPIHVDAASGGFVAPFLDPSLEWDFRAPRVQSINASGHKYGLVYPGVGWVVWRTVEALPPDLIFWVDYLGDHVPTFSLSFSRPGAQVVAQYYNFLRFGRAGYEREQRYARDVATYLSAAVAALGPFELLTRGDELPVFAFTLRDEVNNFSVYDVSTALRERGWQVPAYAFPPNRTDLSVLRVVVRRGFTMDMADMFLEDLHAKVAALRKLKAPISGKDAGGFHH